MHLNRYDDLVKSQRKTTENKLHLLQMQQRGFTLVEILVALFIFSIVSMMLVGALRSVISTQERTDLAANKLRQLQIALLITSRDLQQTVNRPITNAQGHQEEAFVGSPVGFTFTHMGYALQRTGYAWHDAGFFRKSWPSVDQASDSNSHERLLVPAITEASFEYLDPEGHFQHDWPSHSSSAAVIPRAVKITITISDWGTISQVYVVPSGDIKHAEPAAEPAKAPSAESEE